MSRLELFLQFDLAPMMLGILAAMVCTLLGNFLVLRRQSLIGDAVSHVVLPGIVVGFLFAGNTDTLPMMVGATFAAIIAVLLIELIRRIGNIESGAAMGVIFTTMFAVGIVLLEQSGAGNVHLDVQHALYGNLESAIWLGINSWGDLLVFENWFNSPPALSRLIVVFLIVGGFVLFLFKELKITSFDSIHADSLGFSSKGIGFVLIVLTAIAAVAAFEAVGSILVIAMFICPPATARLLTDRLSTQVWLSLLVAMLSGIIGYFLAAFGPIWVGFENSVSAAGMIALVSGIFQIFAMLFAPQYGAIPQRIRKVGIV